nr:DNA translocase FtsK [Azospirillum fermentarium]
MLIARTREAVGFVLAIVGGVMVAMLLTYDPSDPSWNTASTTPARNLLGTPGAYVADLLIQTLGWAAWLLAVLPMAWGWRLSMQKPVTAPLFRLVLALWGVLLAAAAIAGFMPVQADPLMGYPGGSAGTLILNAVNRLLFGGGAKETVAAGAAALSGVALFIAFGLSVVEWVRSVIALFGSIRRLLGSVGGGVRSGMDLARRTRDGALRTAHRLGAAAMGEEDEPPPRAATPSYSSPPPRAEAETARRESPRFGSLFGGGPAEAERPRIMPGFDDSPASGAAYEPGSGYNADDFDDDGDSPRPAGPRPRVVVTAETPAVPPPRHDPDDPDAYYGEDEEAERYELPPMDLLTAPPPSTGPQRVDEAALSKNAEALEKVLSDFGVRGVVQKVHPGPVVTLYELEPAPGTKSSRVIGLAEDIARSMSAVSVRVAVVPGRNVIGIELPNAKRETVVLRELLTAEMFADSPGKLTLALGKDIGGQPVVADLARFPHLLVAGTTGSGKSVAINTMILSLLYRLPPDRCRFIMIDPKMLELSVYEGIPHLLTPVVTDPKKAVVALKWVVREMEDRYRNMSKLGVRNIEGYNARLREARENAESLTRRVQTGFDPDTGKPLFEEQPLDLTELPYIVVIVDEMADLMLVAGKDIEAAIQRLAQMARAAGIHLIMATQRPSVDVITGTIKANFPTRISFQVTTKIDSRTILGEAGAEQLLGQGDMLYMAGGGRITRVHGPFVSDSDVEHVVRYLKSQGEPSYVEAVLEEDDSDPILSDSGGPGGGNGASGDDLYDRAVAVVCRERKASTSFIQRQLRIGYNSAARLIERMEEEGVVSKPNHSGKRDVLARNIEE